MLYVPSVVSQIEHCLGAMHVALIQLCPNAVPVDSPQVEQVLGEVQVASTQECPKDDPIVSLHKEHVLGEVQVAACHLCWQAGGVVLEEEEQAVMDNSNHIANEAQRSLNVLWLILFLHFIMMIPFICFVVVLRFWEYATASRVCLV